MVLGDPAQAGGGFPNRVFHALLLVHVRGVRARDRFYQERHAGAQDDDRERQPQGPLHDPLVERRLVLRPPGGRLPHLDADGVKAAAELNELRSELAAVKADRADVVADRQRIDIERIKLLEVSLMAAEDKRRIEAEYNTKDNILRKTKEELEDVQDQLRSTRTEIARTQDLSEQMSNELRELRLIRASRIWRMMAPLRWVLNSLYHLPGITFLLQHRTLTLQPINHLVLRSENSWTAIDHDPQFILLNNKSIFSLYHICIK